MKTGGHKHPGCAVVVFFAILFLGQAASGLEFSLNDLDSGQEGSTLLVIGGIQGDEPGGFNAASILATRYTIGKGRVRVVPNLNFLSIIKRSRGVYGDLNRKFATIAATDPEYPIIRKVKKLILDPEVDLILNLHDGSGFYREKYEDSMHNPNRWGQCVIIDQERMPAARHGNLMEIAQQVVEGVNHHLYTPEHTYRVNNTHTGRGNDEMAKTLTWFAVQNGKPAFGVEASKSFGTALRAYYHLQVIEMFMRHLGITYERPFSLSSQEVKQVINSDIRLAFYDRKILLDASGVRKQLRYFPLRKGGGVEFTPSNPLLTVVNDGDHFRVFYGNRYLTHIQPQYFEYDSDISGVAMTIDGESRFVEFGHMVSVASRFSVLPEKGYRVNIIGYTSPGIHNECGIPISHGDIQKRFSVDKTGEKFRVEVYRDKRFAGMVLVNFGAAVSRTTPPGQAAVALNTSDAPGGLRAASCRSAAGGR
jgi:hypothetical protein